MQVRGFLTTRVWLSFRETKLYNTYSSVCRQATSIKLYTQLVLDQTKRSVRFHHQVFSVIPIIQFVSELLLSNLIHSLFLIMPFYAVIFH